MGYCTSDGLSMDAVVYNLTNKSSKNVQVFFLLKIRTWGGVEIKFKALVFPIHYVLIKTSFFNAQFILDTPFSQTTIGNSNVGTLPFDIFYFIIINNVKWCHSWVIDSVRSGDDRCDVINILVTYLSPFR